MTGLGLWISTSDRVWTLAARSVFILVWVGFMAVFRGVQDVTIAFMLLHSSKQVDQPPSVSGEGRAAAVPPQRDPTSRPQTPVRPGS
ncbi:MAG: hypothetical protein ACXVX2_17840 [Blastococcus sp.]